MSITTRAYHEVTDTWEITKRNLFRYLRLPRLVFFSSIQPIMFLTLFNFVFGGAISGTGIPGGKYINYLLPGILVQTAMFGGVQTGIGLAEDMTKGIIDRFRSLPMSRAAVLAGRTFSDMIRNLIVIIIMLIAGTVLGFRFQGGVLGAVGMAAVVILFSFAFAWVSGYLGMTTGDAETAQLSGFLFIFPLVFASAAFVPIKTMPAWLQAFARNQPVTFAVNAARELALGLPMDGALWKIIVWSVGILVVFVPLAVWRYRTNAD